MQRIGIMGASFNPPTLGHQSVIEQACHDFDEILLVPSVLHAFKKSLSPLENRLDMLKLLIENELSVDEQHRVMIFNIEPHIQSKHPKQPFVYTYDVLETIETLYSKHQSAQIQFIVGPDLAVPEVWQRFYRYQDIEARWPLYVVKEKVAIHSTMVREVIQQFYKKRSELKKHLVELVGTSIADYILQYHLYTDKDVIS
ncbi:adenylyltransferase/cytidyltransferase family protein [Candidatus Berkiella aquae]|uniref:nicotinate-nucleotide adenylyltransferase n=1 Tax=Candidatus Berkiella aquae TaxID=295108 RepID=A0A0Q9YNG3_9GAMM|nr:adenylyltransferase/cytidyltransferase family protein [Candidatus Berkiella aquae]MCS5712458.1 adenylyltransferase/cytidyltransferase family protein [Candidatus Berkiella aquae]